MAHRLLTWSAMPANSSPSLRHVVLFSFKDSASEADIASIVAGFSALPNAISGITAFEWGTNVSPEGLNDGFTHCFTLSFARVEDRDAYLVHPAHTDFVKTLGCLQRSLVVDYWTR
jgi:hypothetical protein